MTLAKTCHANNVMHDLDKATYKVTATTKLAELRCFKVPLL